MYTTVTLWGNDVRSSVNDAETVIKRAEDDFGLQTAKFAMWFLLYALCSMLYALQ